MPRVFALDHGADNFRDLGWRLTFAKNHFGEALAQRTMMIDFGEIDVFKRQVLEAFQSGSGAEFFALNVLQNFQNIFAFHLF